MYRRRQDIIMEVIKNNLCIISLFIIFKIFNNLLLIFSLFLLYINLF